MKPTGWCHLPKGLGVERFAVAILKLLIVLFNVHFVRDTYEDNGTCLGDSQPWLPQDSASHSLSVPPRFVLQGPLFPPNAPVYPTSFLLPPHDCCHLLAPEMAWIQRWERSGSGVGILQCLIAGHGRQPPPAWADSIVEQLGK